MLQLMNSFFHLLLAEFYDSIMQRQLAWAGLLYWARWFQWLMEPRQTMKPWKPQIKQIRSMRKVES